MEKEIRESSGMEAELRQELAQRLALLAPRPGLRNTDWPGLSIFRSEGVTIPSPTVYAPCLCVVGQGAKLATCGDRTYRYDATQYLVIGASLPLKAQILEASAERPFLSLVVDLDLSFGEGHSGAVL